MEGNWGEGEWSSGLRSAWNKRNMKQKRSRQGKWSRGFNPGRDEESEESVIGSNKEEIGMGVKSLGQESCGWGRLRDLDKSGLLSGRMAINHV